MNKSQNKVLDYYRSIESKLGYKHITWETKHFGYYPDQKSNISERKAQILMQELVHKNLSFNFSQRVLDAGCGYGTTACYLAQKYKAKIIGIDINNYEIERASEKAKKTKLSDLAKFLVMDYSKTNFPDNHFDAIYTLETLSHSSNLQKTLKEFLCILKPGGKIALFEYTLAPEKDFSSREYKMLDLGIQGTAAFGLKEFKHNQFTNYLTKIGFIDVKEQNITKNFLPSIYRLKKIAKIPYIFIKLFRLQKYFINTTIAVEWFKLVQKGLIRYCIFTGKKSV